ncbi:hypothetical protein BD779DRAFT_1669467 [Infundibulicybe gibba]|nr:hypothetical protein BD779DRAFT_1669467 [Infundibulicybe gibba]
MSQPTPHTRSSIDLGSPRNGTQTASGTDKRPIRAHPPRLQHSPSLPNIWFPRLHRDASPAPLNDIPHSIPKRSATPPPRISNASTEAMDITKKGKSGSKNMSPDVLAVSLSPLKKHDQKSGRRRRSDRSHPLLTPPLTPSSSIRTTASTESAQSREGNHTDELDPPVDDKLDQESTRFLQAWIFSYFPVIGNVSRTVTSETLKSAVIGSLTAKRLNSVHESRMGMLAVPGENSKSASSHEESIKGVFVRCQRTYGFVILAFFDVRHARAANSLLSAPFAGPLADCVGSDSPEGRDWFTCRFITAEELVETIGDSPFLATTDGGFFLLVEGRNMRVDDSAKELHVLDENFTEEASSKKTDTEDTNGGRSPNLGMLKTLLKSFGTLQSFALVEAGTGNEGGGKQFRIEYHDARDAASAYAALDGQVLFGMKLKVSGRAPSIQLSRKNIVPFPISSVVGPVNEDDVLYIGPPGHHSRTRERFLAIDPASRTRPQSISASQETLSTPTPHAPETPPLAVAPSPTVFYSSPPPSDGICATPTYDNCGRPFFFDPTLHSNNTEHIPRPMEGDNNRSGYGLGNPRPYSWENDIAPVHDIQCASPYPNCEYCPSRGPSPTAFYRPPYFTQPSAIYFPSHRLPRLPSDLIYPPGPGTYGYSYDGPHASPVIPSVPWSIESAMIAAGAPCLPCGTAPNLGPAQNGEWHPEAPSTPDSLHYPFYARQSQAPQIRTPYYPATNPQVIQEHVVDSPRYLHDTPQRVPSPTRTHHPTSKVNIGRGSIGATERNQLNLAHIESGQDTRTTVMIKNIPNKMSDKDLIAYIGKVCPRRIDFLYLRMDFRNGCNVGYAFVNFITVQDLLCFARKKLGEKWNMFSSEKVLQMSYANYQGKEASVEKFRNSGTMDEQEAWRPKIFYSEPGPMQGLPEPFPEPTHLKRKEQSLRNRGELYVGVGAGGSSQSPGHNSSPQLFPHQDESHVSQSRRRERQHECGDTIEGANYSSTAGGREKQRGSFNVDATYSTMSTRRLGSRAR